MNLPQSTVPRMTVAAVMIVVAGDAGVGFADTVRLNNGDVLSGQVVEQNDTEVIVETDGAGQIRIDRSAIESIDLDSEDLTPESGEAPAAIEPEDNGWFLPGWDKQIEAGFTGSQGNTESLDITAAAVIGQETEEQRTNFSGSYFRSETSGEVTQDEFQGIGRQDWLVPERRYFYFAQSEYEYDDFEPWRHRLSIFGGGGYDFYREEKFDLRGRAGLGANYEFGEVEQLNPEALLGVETSYEINDTQSLAFSNTIFPSLREPGEYRNVTTIDWTLSLDSEAAENEGLSLKFGIKNEYDSDVESDSEHNDLIYFGRLVYGF